MHVRFYLSPLAAALALTIQPSAHAAEAIQVNHLSLKGLQQQFQLLVPGQSQAVTQADSLKVVRGHMDKNKIHHTRLQQYYHNVPVFGGYAINHGKTEAKNLLSQTADHSHLTGKLFNGLQNDLGQPKAGFIKNAKSALEQFKTAFKANQLSEADVKPMVYVDENQQAHWAYQVSVLVEDGQSIPKRPTAIIDADTMKPFVQWDNIKTITRPVKGYGFGGNNKTGQWSYDNKTFPMLEMTRDDELQICYMENNHVKVIDLASDYSSTTRAMSFECLDESSLGDSVYYTGYDADGYDNVNGAYSPSNDALYIGYVIKHMYGDWYNEQPLTNMDGSPMQLVMRVHYGYRYQNAYWDGRQMTFGDGGSIFYPLVSLGVGSHEISHGFTEQHSGLYYFGQSGGMNESFSDMAAMAAEYYSIGTASYLIGPEIVKEDSGFDALRYMDIPSRDGDSIDSADDYYGGLDVHYSSGVFNRMFYLIATTPDWNPRKAFDVMVKANMDYWTPYSSFKDGACGVIQATKDLGYSMDDVRKAINEVAIDTSTC